MRKITISIELLKQKDYSEYQQQNSEYGDKFFQKKFTDKKGVKYFINCKYYFFSNNGQQSRFWEFSMQLNTEKSYVNFDTVQWFNQDGIYSGRTVEDVEEYFEWLWQKHDKPYYEYYNKMVKK